MTLELWSAIDRYIGDHLLAEDPVLDAAVAASEAAGLPPIAITPNQGKLLELLVDLPAPAASSSWDSRRLQHHLAGPCAPAGRTPPDAGARPPQRRGGAREHRARRLAEIVQLRVGPGLKRCPNCSPRAPGPSI